MEQLIRESSPAWGERERERERKSVRGRNFSRREGLHYLRHLLAGRVGVGAV